MRSAAALVLVAAAAFANGSISFVENTFPWWHVAIWLGLALVALAVGRWWVSVHDPVVLVVVGLAGCVCLLGGAPVWAGAMAGYLSGVVAPWLIGRRVATVVQRRAEEEENRRRRTEEMVAEQARLRAADRERLADGMHDAIGHDLALIAVHAGALETDPAASEASRRTGALVRTTAVTATDRLRATLRELRTTSEASWSEELRRLVDGARVTGTEVDLDLPDHPIGRLSFEVVREALTNSLRHAPGARIRVVIVHRDGQDEIAATDTGPATRSHLVPFSRMTRRTGTGLASLERRVRSVGGTFSAGADGRGFTVRAHIPTTQDGPS